MSRLDPADVDVDSTASVSAQPSMAMESGVNGTSKVPLAPKRNAAKLESAYVDVMPFTMRLAASRRLIVPEEPYSASLTAIDPVTSTATMTSVALIARLVVVVTMLGVSIITAASRNIITLRMQAVSVSSLERLRRTCTTTTATANASMSAAIAPPAIQPRAGANVIGLIVSTSMPVSSISQAARPASASTIPARRSTRPGLTVGFRWYAGCQSASPAR